MRSTRKTKTVKNSNVPKNLKKKPRNRSRGIFSWSDDMSGLFLEDLNEVLRENKVRRAECNGSWKVLPKDSCEVYKNRRKRSETNRRKQQNAQNAADSSNYTDSRIEECKSYKRTSRRRQRRRQWPAKRVVVRDKRRKRYHGSETSYSNSSSSITTTDTSGTEMDYE